MSTLDTVVFSKEYENIIEQVDTQNEVDYDNVALVGGEGEGDARIFVTTSGGIGEDRYDTLSRIQK